MGNYKRREQGAALEGIVALNAIDVRAGSKHRYGIGDKVSRGIISSALFIRCVLGLIYGQ